MPQSILAFDYGTKNIGAASGNTATQTCSELKPLKARDGIPDWADLEQLLKEYSCELVLVGLPLNMDDSESELSTRARKFANRIHGRFGIQVELVDERLSTIEAKKEALERGIKGDYKNNPVDSIAARILLEGFFANQGLDSSV